MKNMCNFAIIAHIDHGKSTLADRFLEITGVFEAGKHEEQLLDRNPISRERGITIKLAPVRMEYGISNLEYGSDKAKIQNSKFYILNLIDTPGHVDFSYEVERTLSCVEGVILLVDATAGIQAQTVAHAYKALEQDLVLIPAINKIDLPQAEIEKTKSDLKEFLGVKESEIYEVSAKTGQGVEKLLQVVIEKTPPPHATGPVDNGLRALIFDSYYDEYRGVIAFVRVFEGQLKTRDKVKLFASNEEFEVKEVGFFAPELKKKEKLSTGEIGYIVTNLKDIHKVRVGDTIAGLETKNSLPGYREVKPMVFASFFPTASHDFPDLKKSLQQFALNDASISFEQIYSPALGSGFRIGFLGVLHADVVRERLEREFDLDLVLTTPTVEYMKKRLGSGKFKYLEPIVRVEIITPDKYTGAVMRLCESKRAKFITMDNRFQTFISYQMPLSELIVDFFDQLKTVTSGYGSLDWEFKEYQEADIDKLEILINGDPVEEFSQFTVREKAEERSRELTAKLRKLIPRQQYEVRIQAKYKGRIIASERIPPFRKDVTAKLYGGDRTRKEKLLKKQKKGKKRMKSVGRVDIPKDAFVQLFKK